MKSVGELLRKLREEQKQFLREVAAGIGIDQALLAKLNEAKGCQTRNRFSNLLNTSRLKKMNIL